MIRSKQYKVKINLISNFDLEFKLDSEIFFAFHIVTY